VLHDWARNQERKKSEELKKSEQAVRHKGKKLYWQTRFGKIEIEERTYTSCPGGVTVRPFCSSAQVRCRSYSLPLQRAITDFGSEASFLKIAGKLREHYGIEVPMSSSRTITLHHAEEVLRAEKIEVAIPQSPGVEVVVAEMDGSMIPVVETSAPAEGVEKVDRRKTRKVEWKEARLALAHPKDCVTPVYAATMGTTEEAGDRLLHCAIRTGLGAQTRVHALGDGAPWIADQVSLKFGVQGGYLVDFYHLCDYLSGAGDACCGARDKKAWMEEQKQRMKENRSLEVLQALRPHLEKESVKSKDAPVRACYRYIENRPGQFDYKSAIESGLPIGSGEVESGHRYVIQDRLKLTGAWWKPQNAQSMLAMRVMRANSQWEAYWDRHTDKAVSVHSHF
jgi:hypothetical protein